MPDYANPQVLNRYSYVLNNPIRYSDPSGHRACDGEGGFGKCQTTLSIKTELMRKYRIRLSGKWNSRDEQAALDAVVAVAKAMSTVSGRSADAAFRDAYATTANDMLEFKKVGSYTFNGKSYSDGAVTINHHLIEFATLSQPGGNRTDGMAFTSARNNVVHELGHSFARTSNDLKLDTLPGKFMSEDGWPTSPISANLTWRQHPSSMDGGQFLSGEVYADMFLGWTFGVWGQDPEGYGAARRNYMTNSMEEFWADS